MWNRLTVGLDIYDRRPFFNDQCRHPNIKFNLNRLVLSEMGYAGRGRMVKEDIPVMRSFYALRTNNAHWKGIVLKLKCDHRKRNGGIGMLTFLIPCAMMCRTMNYSVTEVRKEEMTSGYSSDRVPCQWVKFLGINSYIRALERILFAFLIFGHIV
jgi:hypothetical protein